MITFSMCAWIYSAILFGIFQNIKLGGTCKLLNISYENSSISRIETSNNRQLVLCDRQQNCKESDSLRILTICTIDVDVYKIITDVSLLQGQIPDFIVIVTETLIRSGFPFSYNNTPIIFLHGFGNWLAPSQCNCEKEEKYMFSLQREINFILGETITLMKNLNWKSLVLIHDDTTDFISDCVASTLEQLGIFLLKYNIVEAIDRPLTDVVFDLLTEVYRYNVAEYLQEINILVTCRLDCINHVLEQANKFDFTEENYGTTALYFESRWLILPTCKSDFSNIPWSLFDALLNIAVVNINTSWIQRNISTNQIKTFLEEEGASQFCEREMKNLSLLLRHNGADQYIYEIETLTMNPNRTLAKANISNYEDVQNQIYPNIKHGFNGRKFTTTTIVYYPFVAKKKLNEKITYYGYCMDLLEELADILNFTYEVSETPDNEFGALLPNGSWTGIVGLLQQRKVDLAVAPLTIEARREMVMDFTVPFYFDSMTFLMKRPDESKTWKLFPGLFHWMVLLTITLSLFVCAFILYILENFTSRNKIQTEHRLLYAVTYLYGALMSKGYIPPVSRSSRIFVTGWWILALVITTTYCGNLVAFLTVVKEIPPIETFEDLVSQTRYKWGTIGGSVYETLFKTSSDPIFQKLGEGIERDSKADPSILHKDQDIHIRKVLDENYAYLFEKTHFEILMRNDCRYIVADDEYPSIQYGVGLPENSPLTRIFSEKITQLIESGFHYKWIDRHWPDSVHCKNTHRTEARTISIKDVQSSFYLIGIGLGFSLFVLATEWILSKSLYLSSGKEEIKLDQAISKSPTKIN